VALTLTSVENDIESWIRDSRSTFEDRYLDEHDQLWVLKFFPPQFLGDFMRRPELLISSTPGFTWGDGIYVVPLEHVYSGMIYGRVGVMGWIDKSNVSRVYNAADSTGLSLYQEWIQFKPGLFRLLTTTVHSQFANRRLRNGFRRRFNIDLVVFRPDEFNRAYVQPPVDRWCVVSDFNVSAALPAGTLGFSTRIRDCEFVAVGTEEFIIGRNGFVRHDAIGPQVHASTPVRLPPRGHTHLHTSLQFTYTTNRKRGANPPSVVWVKP
jgi:hypothetical protein